MIRNIYKNLIPIKFSRYKKVWKYKQVRNEYGRDVVSLREIKLLTHSMYNLHELLTLEHHQNLLHKTDNWKTRKYKKYCNLVLKSSLITHKRVSYSDAQFKKTRILGVLLHIHLHYFYQTKIFKNYEMNYWYCILIGMMFNLNIFLLVNV